MENNTNASVRYDNDGIHIGNALIKYEDIGKVVFSNDDEKTNIHIFNKNTNKHIGRIYLNTDSNKEFISKLSKKLQSANINIDYSKTDEYSSLPLENYQSIGNKKTKGKKHGFAIAAFVIIIFVVGWHFLGIGNLFSKSGQSKVYSEKKVVAGLSEQLKTNLIPINVATDPNSFHTYAMSDGKQYNKPVIGVAYGFKVDNSDNVIQVQVIMYKNDNDCKIGEGLLACEAMQWYDSSISSNDKATDIYKQTAKNRTYQYNGTTYHMTKDSNGYIIFSFDCN